MNEFYEAQGFTNSQSIDTGFKGHLARVFGWMFLGLVVTTAAAVLLSVGVVEGQYWSYMMLSSVGILLIAEVVVVICLSAMRNKVSTTVAKLLFLAYALLNGFTIGSMILSYVLAGYLSFYTAGIAFGLAAVTFGVMALVGYFTKIDLSKFSAIAFIGLIMIIVFSLFNMIFFRSSGLDLLICYVGLFIFIGLTAFDVQRIKKEYQYYASTGDSATLKKAGIFSALGLYLDFINIYLYILRLFTRGNNN